MDNPEAAWKQLNDHRRQQYNHPEGSTCPVCNGSGHVMAIWSDAEYTEELHNALEEALSQLAAKQADVVRRHYFEGKAISEIAREDGTTRNAAQNREQAAFAALRRNPKLQRWRDEIISTRAWSGTGFGAWNHRGSVEERTVEYLEAWEAKSRVWAAERAQLIKEHYADFEASGYFDRNPEQRPTLQTG